MLKSLPSHLFVGSDGTLNDTRLPNWHLFPIRQNYSFHHRRMASLSDVKASLRAGEFAWPGGYSTYFITSDGGCLCHKCVRKEWRQVVWDWLQNCSSGWRVVAMECSADCDETQLCE